MKITRVKQYTALKCCSSMSGNVMHVIGLICLCYKKIKDIIGA